MNSLNKCTLIGRVGKDPIINTAKTGSIIANFSLATSESWKDKSGERKEKTEWHNICVMNEHKAKFVQGYVKKGAQLFIEGKLSTSKYTDKQGIERYSTQIELSGFDCKLFFTGDKQKDTTVIHKQSDWIDNEDEETF